MNSPTQLRQAPASTPKHRTPGSDAFLDESAQLCRLHRKDWERTPSAHSPTPASEEPVARAADQRVMNTTAKNPIPGPATTPGQKKPTTKPETKAPTADAADTHTRRRDEIQLPENSTPLLKPKNP